MKPMGATINDAFLCIIGGAVRRYLREVQGEGCEAALPASLTALVTCNARRGAVAPLHGVPALKESLLGNRSIPLLVPTSLDADPRRRVLQAKSCMDRLKCSPVLAFAGILHQFGALCMNFVMVRSLFQAWLRIRRSFGTTIPFPSILLTNVPGPQQPRQVLGQTVEGIQAFAALPNVFAAFSYNGLLRISYTADCSNVSADLMTRCIDAEAASLLEKLA
eukprot:TRINITY_DN1784_c1_g2_i1.p1 TRINITY_DN1784_c1_g2~~TRINITY_DN1784_c1_g2_i1.p1  ORF type:complete len:220 (-),score=44.48 TRINITY_DN1784_c1_g2_i1:73-732(-)